MSWGGRHAVPAGASVHFSSEDEMPIPEHLLMCLHGCQTPGQAGAEDP